MKVLTIHNSAILLALCAAFLAGCATDAAPSVPVRAMPTPADRVNLFVGTDYNGHVFPGACCPMGLVQASPDTGHGTWHYCSGYRNSDTTIIGFSQTHLSGTGCADLGDLRLLPGRDIRTSDVAYHQDKSRESATPGYYSAFLIEPQVKVEVTATPHVAVYRFKYEGGLPAQMLVDCQYGICAAGILSTHVLDSDVKVESSGFRISGRVQTRVWVERNWYFVFDCNHKFKAVELPAAPGEKAPRYVLTFADMKPDDTVEVRVALSAESVNGAAKNLSAAHGRDFRGIAADARAAWNRLLGRVEAKGTDDQLASFYTSLYHLFVQPNNIADAGKPVRYSTFSCWDTFRAAHPLYTILTPENVAPFVNSMVEDQKKNGFTSIWTLWGEDNQCMIGTHSVPVIVDAYLKGLRDFDAEEAYGAIRASLRESHANRSKENWNLLDKYGYYPFDMIKAESASRTLECAYDDWCAAQMAKALGKDEDFAFFSRRAQNYRNLFDKESLLMRPRDSEGRWIEPFNPFRMGYGEGYDFTEGNAWQYTWHVMHDPEGLVELFGGREKFAERLDMLFKFPERIEGQGEVGDATGLIGQYAHGNEPSHHVAYFYQYAGRPRRTAEIVREVFDRFYLNKPDGLCGNDDCGQMSAWYVFSAMGFYPFNPCGGEYVLGAPQLPEVTLRLPGGRVFTIMAKNLSEKNKYVKSVCLNGKKLDGFKITHEEIMAGGTLEFEMED
jgi:predicted alpha-1,2-mannosidase